MIYYTKAANRTMIQRKSVPRKYSCALKKKCFTKVCEMLVIIPILIGILITIAFKLLAILFIIVSGISKNHKKITFKKNTLPHTPKALNVIEKVTQAPVFSYDFCENIKSTVFTEQVRTATPELIAINRSPWRD